MERLQQFSLQLHMLQGRGTGMQHHGMRKCTFNVHVIMFYLKLHSFVNSFVFCKQLARHGRFRRQLPSPSSSQQSSSSAGRQPAGEWSRLGSRSHSRPAKEASTRSWIHVHFTATAARGSRIQPVCNSVSE